VYFPLNAEFIPNDRLESQEASDGDNGQYCEVTEIEFDRRETTNYRKKCHHKNQSDKLLKGKKHRFPASRLPK
jgi:hypothetical protein